jgi:hypothetical protein
MKTCLLTVAAIAASLLATPALAQSRSELITSMSQQIESMMAVCGIAPTDSTESKIARRMDDDNFDLHHARTLVLAAVAASMQPQDEDSNEVVGCKQWREVFRYTGAIR